MKIPNYLLADPAYPPTPFCMKEYEHCSTNDEVIFNQMLRSARNPIECVFGGLKARWGILTRKMDLKLESTPVVINPCFILHNFCERIKSYFDEDLIRAQLQHIRSKEEIYKNIPDPVFSYDAAAGRVCRRTLTNYIKKTLYMLLM